MKLEKKQLTNEVTEQEQPQEAQQVEQEENSKQPINSTPEDNGGQGGKMFTQEEVNNIVRERLARERAKNGQGATDQSSNQEALTTCMRYCLDSGLDSSALEMFDTSDPAKFIENVEKARELFKPKAQPKFPGFKIGFDRDSAKPSRPDPFAAAFAPKGW